MSQSVTPCHFTSLLNLLTYLLTTSWKNSVAERRGVLCGLCCCTWGVEGREKSARCTQGAGCRVQGARCTVHGARGVHARRLGLPWSAQAAQAACMYSHASAGRLWRSFCGEERGGAEEGWRQGRGMGPRRRPGLTAAPQPPIGPWAAQRLTPSAPRRQGPEEKPGGLGGELWRW